MAWNERAESINRIENKNAAAKISVRNNNNKNVSFCAEIGGREIFIELHRMHLFTAWINHI